MIRNTLFILMLCVFIISCIGGCTPSTQTKKSVTPLSPNQSIYIPKSSDSRKAMRHYQRALRTDDEKLREEGMIKSVKLFMRAGDNQAAESVLDELNEKPLANRTYIDLTLLKAQLAEEKGDWPAVKKWLYDPRFNQLKSVYTVQDSLRKLNLQINLNVTSGEINKNIEKAYYLSEYLESEEEKYQLHSKMWNLINRLPYDFLNQQAQEQKNHGIASWYHLGAILRTTLGNREDKLKQFAKWRGKNPIHPAAIYPPLPLATALPSKPTTQSVAILLPFQDEYREVSQALLNGFFSGYYRFLSDQVHVPDIHIYDSSSRALHDVYSEAVSRGADLIIGPLRSAGVRSLIGLEELPVTTISLNRIKTKELTGPKNLIQFGLSPLDEMEQIAQRAILHDKRRVLLIAPEIGWGRRASEHFENIWLDYGGSIIETLYYPEKIKDFNPLLRSPLHIDASEARGINLKRFVNKDLITRERRRQDIDLVVMLGYPAVARQIKPSLEFLYAGDIPVFATSHVYSGIEQSGVDRDLTGVEFCAMPWTLKGQLPAELEPDKELHPALRNFYALGYDTFIAHRELLNFKQGDNQVPVFAATGVLTLSEGHLKRRTGWAKFGRSAVLALPLGK